MIPSFIGAGIGTQYAFPNPASLQVIKLKGMVKIPGDDCSCNIDFSYNLDAKIVEGNDLRLRLEIYDQDGGEIALDGFENIFWTFRAYLGGPVILQKSLGDGVSISDAVYVEIDGEEIDGFNGTFVHEFMLIKDGNVSTVVANPDLEYGEFVVRKKIAIP